MRSAIAAAFSQPLPEGSATLRGLFVALTLLVAMLFVAGVHWSARLAGIPRATARMHGAIAAGATTLWLIATGVAAARGALHFEVPPTMLPVFPLIFAIAIGVALSRVGRRLSLAIPIAALVGFQGFRVAVELLLHRAFAEGLMPIQMSYAGRNLDIVSAITAIFVGLWLAGGRSSPRLVFAWNTLGAALLLNILVVALLSAPTPMRVFMNEPSNIWVTRAPWIWLPTVMVLAAIMGHALVYRRLWVEWRAGARMVNAAPGLLSS
jgi:hypothetical protein